MSDDRKSSGGKVAVVVRCRPYLSKEVKDEGEAPFIMMPETNCVEIVNNKQVGAETSALVFDHVYDETSNTKDIYQTVLEDMVKSTCDGYNMTTFAYGQTASGKTHTMMGTDTTPGIIRLSMQSIFDRIKEETNDRRQYTVRVCYMEIYNEKIFDLLSKDLKTIKIFEGKNKAIAFDNIQEETVKDADQAMSVITRGEGNRTIAKTFANDNSSRSHTIFRMVIERKDELIVDEETAKNMSAYELKVLKSKPVVRVGQLNLVDLAGSENAHKHEDSDRMREGKNINLSLLHLKEVIIKLSKGQKIESFRNSKLTRILGNSLSGNAKVAVICNINPIHANIDQTKQTLHFGNCAGKISIAPQVNGDPSNAVIVKYQSQIEELTKEVADLQEKLRRAPDEIFEQAMAGGSFGSIEGGVTESIPMTAESTVSEVDGTPVIRPATAPVTGKNRIIMELNNAKEQTMALENQLKQIETQKNELIESVKSAEETNVFYQTKIKDMEAQNEVMIQKNGEIIAEMTKISEENQYVAERFKSAQIEINDLSESLNAVNNVLVMEKQKLQMTIEQKEEFSAKLKQIETEKATLAENVKSSEQKNVKYETIITELEQKNAKLVQESEMASAQMGIMTADYQRVEDRLKESQNENMDLIKKVTSATVELENAKHKAQAAVHEKELVSHKLQKSETERTETAAKYREIIIEKEKQAVELVKVQNEVKDIKMMYEKSIEELRESVSIKQDQIQELANANASLNQRIESKEHELSSMKDKIDRNKELSAYTRKLERQNAELIEQTSNLNDGVEALREQLRMMAEENQQYRICHLRYHTRVVELEHENQLLNEIVDVHRNAEIDNKELRKKVSDLLQTKSNNSNQANNTNGTEKKRPPLVSAKSVPNMNATALKQGTMKKRSQSPPLTSSNARGRVVSKRVEDIMVDAMRNIHYTET